MNDDERDARWQEILDAQADFVDEPAPLRPVRDGDAPRRPRRDRKSQRFDEALSGLGSWSTLEGSRRRLSA